MTTWYVDLVGGTDTLQTKSITGATKANPCVITSAGHGYQNGQVISISGATGMTQLNGFSYTVANVTLNTYELSGINSTAYGTYGSSGISTITGRLITNITQANPCVVTCVGHGYSNNDYVFINAVGGMTELNDKCFKVANKATDTFELSGINSTGYAAWTSGGTTQRAFLTVNGAHGSASGGEEVRVGLTTAPTQYTSSNLTWTNNSATVATSVSLIGSFAVNDYIGRNSVAGNGAVETFYRVSAITAAAITLESKYYGITGTDTASVYKLNPQVTGAVNTIAITISKSIILSGGWDLITSVQNGETWIRVNALRTQGSVCLTTTSACTISKLNIVESYKGIYVNSASSVSISNCSCNGSHLYQFDCSGTNTTISNCIGVGGGGTNWPAIYVADTNCIVANSVFIGASNGVSGQLLIGSKLIGATLANTVTGVSLFASNSTLESCIIIDCSTYGVNAGGSNSKISNCSFTRTAVGVFFGSVATSLMVSGCSFTNCTTYGIQFSQSRGALLSGNVFTSNQIDVYMDNYSSDVVCVNNTHLTPVAYSYSRTIVSGVCYLYKCSIDAPSLAKAFLTVTGASYLVPQYVIQNSFGGLYGTYWANGQITKDSSVYRTAGPSLKMAYNTTVAYNLFDIKMVACYAKANQAKKFSLYMKRDSTTWTGTIVPHFKLDGVTLTTETTITSLTTSWVLYEWTCPAVSITSDGELSMEFTLNANSTAIWIDDFTVTDV